MKLAYLQQGFGSECPLVLLHAYPLNSRMWCNQLGKLSKNRHIVAPDFRGYGRSRPDPGDSFTIEQFASDVRKTLKNTQVNKAIIAGCSMGGYVVFELWRQAPELFAGMMLVDTKAEADDDAARAKRLEIIDKVRDTGTSDIPELVSGLLSDDTRRNEPEVERTVRSMAAEPTCETIIRSLEMLANRPDSVPTLATIDVPTLVIVGENDKVTTLENARTMQETIEDCTLETIPGAGHLSPMENPEAVCQAMGSYLDGCVIS